MDGATMKGLRAGWNVSVLVDDDGHLNVFITNDDGSTIDQIETGQGDGLDGGEMACRYTTENIETQHANIK